MSGPSEYNEIDLENLRDDSIKINGERAIIIRSNRALNFQKIENNSNKTIYINGSRIVLLKHLHNGVYRTAEGTQLNLRDMINQGLLNHCIFNGNVARRYATAHRRESNAERYGKP